MRAPSIICIATVSFMAISWPAFSGEIRGENRALSTTSVKDLSTRYGSMPGAGTTADQEKSVAALASSNSHVTRRGGDVTSESRAPDSPKIASIVDRYGSMPGGVVLEGAAQGLDGVTSAQFDPNAQSLILGKNLIFKPETAMSEVAELARALAEDDRVGVSLTSDSVIAYGAIPEESDLARNLSVADVFLADFIVPPREWTTGYRTAGGFEPISSAAENEVVAFYNFHDFAFEVRDGTIVATGAKADIYVVPVLEERANDGGYLPDLVALENGTAKNIIGEIKKNADHVALNMNYYLGERAARRAVAYGEVAAVLRHLKATGTDLEALADEIEENLPETADVSWSSLETAWTDYLREIQTAGDFANWTAPPLDLYVGRSKNQKEAAVVAPQP